MRPVVYLLHRLLRVGGEDPCRRCGGTDWGRKGSDGRSRYCKQCAREYSRRRYRSRKEAG